MRKGQMIINENLHKYDFKNCNEVLPCRHGDLIVFDKDFIGGDFPVFVSIIEGQAITSHGAIHATCNHIMTGSEWFDNFYN